MGGGFESHGIEGTGDFIEPVSGTALQPIEGLLEDTQFIRLAEWSSYGGFDDGVFIIE